MCWEGSQGESLRDPEGMFDDARARPQRVSDGPAGQCSTARASAAVSRSSLAQAMPITNPPPQILPAGKNYCSLTESDRLWSWGNTSTAAFGQGSAPDGRRGMKSPPFGYDTQRGGSHARTSRLSSRRGRPALKADTKGGCPMPRAGLGGCHFLSDGLLFAARSHHSPQSFPSANTTSGWMLRQPSASTSHDSGPGGCLAVVVYLALGMFRVILAQGCLGRSNKQDPKSTSLSKSVCDQGLRSLRAP